MHFCYIDDSGDQQIRVFSVLAVPENEWRTCFQCIRQFRRGLKQREGVYVKAEFHATEFVAGRGRLAPNAVPKGARCRIFRETLARIATLPGVRLFNAVVPKHLEDRGFERLLNRVNRTMREWNSHALLISDEGKDYTALMRRMAVHNPIPSQYGAWPEGTTRNLTLDWILEDIFFRKSDKSYFVQMADFCAYALLRSEKPLPSKDKYGLNLAFDILAPICVTQCFAKDPRKLGIIRET